MCKKGRKHILFLLGAGFSAPAGLPIAKDLWGKILKHFYLQLEDEFSSSSVIEKPFSDWWLFPFWKVLNTYPNEFEINYEEFYDRLLSEKDGTLCTTCLRKFISESVNNYRNDGNNLSLKDRLFNGWNQELVKNYRNSVESCINVFQNNIYVTLSHINNLDKYDSLVSIINNLCLCGNCIDIFTLNHDLLVERILQTWGILFNDGFDHNNEKKIGKHSFYDVKTNIYEKGNVNLYKLHGSIDLYKYTEKDSNGYRYAKVINGNAFMMSDETIFEPLPYFLTGTTAKLKEYNDKYISYLMSLFEMALVKSQNLIMIGYSGNDDGINEIILKNYDHWNEAVVVTLNANNHPFVKDKQAKALNKGVESLSLNDLNIT